MTIFPTVQVFSLTSSNFVITHLNFSSGYRGGERQTTLLIQELAQRNVHQQLFTRLDSELARRCAGIKNLEIIKIDRPYILSFAKFKSSQLLHAHETKGVQVAFLLNKIYRTPYIITRRVNNRIKHNAFTKAMYRHSSYNVALSHAIKAGILQVAPESNVPVIPSAQTDFSINPAQVAKIKQRFKGKLLIGNIGELENRDKGQYYLIEAIKKLALERDDLHFIFLGKGPDEDSYRQQAKELTNVTFEGFVDNVGDYIAAMNLFVFPSLNEGLGSILLDVMKLKVPVIASNTGGIPDIVKDQQTGLLVEPKDIDGIQQSIQLLLTDQTLASQLSEAAYLHTLNFSPTSMTDAYQALYQTIYTKSLQNKT